MINDEFVDQVRALLSSLFLRKKKYNLISEQTWYRYSYCLKRLCKYLENKEFDDFDDLVLAVNDWKTQSNISLTISKKFLDIAFILRIINKQ